MGDFIEQMLRRGATQSPTLGVWHLDLNPCPAHYQLYIHVSEPHYLN